MMEFHYVVWPQMGRVAHQLRFYCWAEVIEDCIATDGKNSYSSYGFKATIDSEAIPEGGSIPNSCCLIATG